MAIIALFSKKFRDWASFRIMLAKASFEPGQPLTPIEPEGKLIETLSQLKVSKWIKISITGDLTELIIEGTATSERIKQTWADLQNEHYEKAGGEEAERYKEAYRKIVKLTLRLNHVGGLCDQFELLYDQVFIDALKDYGYSYPFTEDSYLKDIRRVRTGEKRFASMLTKLKADFEKAYTPKGGNKKTESDYYNTVEELRKHGNYQDDPYTLADKWFMDTYSLLLGRLNADRKRQNEQLLKEQAKKK